MSKAKPIDLLSHAREKEKDYNWIAAIEFHEKVLGYFLQGNDSLGAGETSDRIGYCFQRAAMQASSWNIFKKRTKLAIKAYQRAQEFYEALPDHQKVGRELRNKALVKYLTSWLVSKGVKKRKLLDQCLELEGRALEQFEHFENMLEYGRTYNELWPVFFLRAFLEWDRQALLRLINKGIDWGKNAVLKLSELDNPYELARAYFTLATCLTFIGQLDNKFGFYLIEPEEIERNNLLVIENLTKALDCAKNLGDYYLSGLLNLWLAFNTTRGENCRRYYEKALELSTITKDHFLIVLILDTLVNDIAWESYTEPAQKSKLAEKYLKFYDKAEKHAAIIHFRIPSAGPMTAPFGRATYYHECAMFFEVDSEKRGKLLSMAEKAGFEALEVARITDMPNLIVGTLHTLGKIFLDKARLEIDSNQKYNRLRKALEFRKESIQLVKEMNPFDYGTLSVILGYLAENKAKLAEVEQNPRKKKLLQEAVIDKEKSLEYCNKAIPHLEKIGQFDYFSVFSNIQDRFATMLTQLHDLTKQSANLRRSIEILQSAIEPAKKQGFFNLTAELHWKIAKAHDILEEYSEAAESFNEAAENYLRAAKKIPQLNDFFQSHAVYMRAWIEIEKGKAAHYRKQYKQAKKHYKKAASLHKSTIQWRYLSLNYMAWAQLESAEELSRKEKIEEARKKFLKTVGLFERAKESIYAKLESALSKEEKELANTLLKASEKRREYCLGRIMLEEARIQDRRGDHLRSAEKYGTAAKIFGRIAKDEKELSRRQLLPIFYLCQAWQRMMMAEAATSSKAYDEAADLFKQAKEYTFDRETSLLSLASSSFCKALASGTEFEITRDLNAYARAKKHMEVAENYYLKAGNESASEYAKATMTLLDAYMYTTKAEMETEPSQKAKYYKIAEKTLKNSIDSYKKAKYPEKSVEVQRFLNNIVEKGNLAMSLVTVLPDSRITATTNLFSAPTPTHEEAVGYERFEHAELEANITISREATAGEQIEVKLDIVNVGRRPGLLLRIQSLAPAEFKITSSSPQLKIEDNLIDMKGKRIIPLKVESLKLWMQSKETGNFTLKPQIGYVDEIGNFKQCFPKPTTITVYPKIELGFRTNAAQKVFEYLVRSFVEDYMRRKLILKESGWRSYVQIMKNAKVSARKVYGSKAIPGIAISELQRRGLIEIRIFPGERGRGGKIMRTRICYDREVVKRLVDYKVAKNE